MNDLTAETERAWIALARAYRFVLEDVERALKAAGLPPLEWYDVLLEVERAGPDGLRPYALQERLLLPQYGMSRLIDRMERAGLVAKHRCDADRRGFEVRITALGRRTRRQMWPVYSAALGQALQDSMPTERMKALAELLTPVVRPPG